MQQPDKQSIFGATKRGKNDQNSIITAWNYMLFVCTIGLVGKNRVDLIYYTTHILQFKGT